MMELSIITPETTIHHQRISDITIPSFGGDKHINTIDGSVELMNTGKATILLQKKGQTQPEKIEFYVEGGLVYVQHSTIRLVTSHVTQC